jgi:hypothetical protein
MSITELNTDKLTPAQLSAYRNNLIDQLSNTIEYLVRANTALNEVYEEQCYSASEDIKEYASRNGICL